MSYVSADKLVEAMTWRYATKAFDGSREIAREERAALLAALRLSPSSYGLQPWLFLMVDDPAKREKLGSFVPANKPKIENSSLFIVLARRKSTTTSDVVQHVRMLQAARGVTTETLKPFEDMLTSSISSKTDVALDAWNARQVYVALGCAVASAGLLGIDACPMEGVDPPNFDEALGLTGSDFTTSVAIAFGYRDPKDPFTSYPRTRRTIKDVIKIV